jgi:hypothetical protein
MPSIQTLKERGQEPFFPEQFAGSRKGLKSRRLKRYIFGLRAAPLKASPSRSGIAVPSRMKESE